MGKLIAFPPVVQPDAAAAQVATLPDRDPCTRAPSGSRHRVRIHLVDGKSRKPSRPRGKPHKPALGAGADGARHTMDPVRILIIEGDEINAAFFELLAGALRHRRLSMARAKTLGEAKRVFQEEPVDLCIASFWIAGVSSLRILQDLTHERRECPFLIITSAAQTHGYVAAPGTANVTFLPREPLSARKLDRTLAAALAGGAALPLGRPGGQRDQTAMLDTVHANAVLARAALRESGAAPARRHLDNLIEITEIARLSMVARPASAPVQDAHERPGEEASQPNLH